MSLEALEKKFEEVFRLCELLPDGVAAVEKRIEEKLGNKRRVGEATRRALERSLADLRAAKTKAFLTFAGGGVDPVVYQEAARALDKQEAKLSEGLSHVDGDLSLPLRVVRIAKELASDISASYGRATPVVRALLAQAFFERFEVLDGDIVRANLTAPVDYVLHRNLERYPVFELAP